MDALHIVSGDHSMFDLRFIFIIEKNILSFCMLKTVHRQFRYFLGIVPKSFFLDLPSLTLMDFFGTTCFKLLTTAIDIVVQLQAKLFHLE